MIESEWSGCICNFCAERYPGARAERDKVITDIENDPESKLNRFKRGEDVF
jgi:hypothetical protein